MPAGIAIGRGNCTVAPASVHAGPPPFFMPRPLLLICAALVAGPAVRADASDHFRAELVGAERHFCTQVAELGIADAFLANMDDANFRPEALGLGRAEYEAAVKAGRAKAGSSYKPGPNPAVKLTWEPIKVDVSADGTLGYTWGRYDYTSKGASGKSQTLTGIYLTIWKRQADGSWKFVFDGSPELPDDPAALARFLARPDLPHPPR
jgi:hypothetical protein